MNMLSYLIIGDKNFMFCAENESKEKKQLKEIKK